MAATRMGVMGGTFDPPHIGHLAAADDVRTRLAVGTVLWIPAGTPPHKDEETVSPAHHRLEMVRLATAGNPAFEVSELEIRNPEPSYSVRTLECLRQLYPDRELVFFLGSDEFATLPQWYEPERIPVLAHIAVMCRPGADPDTARVEAQLPQVRGRYSVVPVAYLQISSSEIRQRLRQGLPIRYLVPPAVASYIEAERLYRA